MQYLLRLYPRTIESKPRGRAFSSRAEAVAEGERVVAEVAAVYTYTVKRVR
jgi:hypothetical protein